MAKLRMRKTNTVTIYGPKGGRFHIHPEVARRLGISEGYKASSQDEVNDIISDNVLYHTTQSTK